MNTVIESHII